MDLYQEIDFPLKKKNVHVLIECLTIIKYTQLSITAINLFTSIIISLLQITDIFRHDMPVNTCIFVKLSWRVRLAKQGTLTPPGHLVSPLVCRGPWMSTVVLYCWCHSDRASVLLYIVFYIEEKEMLRFCYNLFCDKLISLAFCFQG